MTAVSPVATTVSSMNADRRRNPGDPQGRDLRTAGSDAATEEAAPSAPAPDAVADLPPPVTPATAPDSTFAASQLVERLRLLEANLRVLGQTPWAPPESDLNLRDRTV